MVKLNLKTPTIWNNGKIVSKIYFEFRYHFKFHIILSFISLHHLIRYLLFLLPSSMHIHISNLDKIKSWWCRWTLKDVFWVYTWLNINLQISYIQTTNRSGFSRCLRITLQRNYFQTLCIMANIKYNWTLQPSSIIKILQA